ISIIEGTNTLLFIGAIRAIDVKGIVAITQSNREAIASNHDCLDINNATAKELNMRCFAKKVFRLVIGRYNTKGYDKAQYYNNSEQSAYCIGKLISTRGTPRHMCTSS